MKTGDFYVGDHIRLDLALLSFYDSIRMNDLIQSFQFHLGRKELVKLDAIWLELVDSDADTDALLELADLTERYAAAGKAEAFLWVLADALKEKERWEKRLDVLKRLVRLNPDSAQLSSELADCYRRIHGSTPELERLLQKTGLGYGRPANQALEKTERYVSLLPGAWLYNPEWGACRVEKLDLLLDRVTMKCDGLSEYALNLDSAASRLKPLARDGYFRRLAEDRHTLKEIAAQEPAKVVLGYLKDTNQLAGVKELKAGLADLVPEKDWEGFWNRARKALDHHPHVVVRTRPGRAYQYSERPVDKQVRVSAASVESETEPADEGLSALSDREIVSRLDRLAGTAGRKRFIEQVKQSCPERWPALAVRFFVTGKDRRILNRLEAELAQTDPRTHRRMLNETVTNYRQNPDAFLWLAENGVRLGSSVAAAAVTRIVDMLEGATFKKLWPRLHKALARNEWQLLDESLTVTDPDSARALLARIARLSLFAPYEKEEVAAVFAARFPELAAEPKAEAIFSTASGIEQGRKELSRLVQEDIPRSAEEVGRARAHGDLSENYEYKVAKEKQARLMQRANRLQQELSRARAITPTDIDTSHVTVGCRVKVEDSSGTEQEYAILGPWDSDPDRGIVSYLAPLGQKLLNRRPGESVEFDGRIMTVAAISPAL